MKLQKNIKQVKTSSSKNKQKQIVKKQLQKNKNTSKKISLKQTIGKVIDVIKKPFTRKKGQSQKQKSTIKRPKHEKILIDNTKQKKIQQQKNEDVQKIETQQSIQNKPYVDIPFAESTSGASYSKFFYSSNYAIDNFDDQQLYDVLSQKYPGLLASEESEVVKRNAIVSLLNDVETMQLILNEYNMTVLDFFKFLFRLCPSVFKGLFVKKIQKTIKDKPYAQSIKFGKYHFPRKKSSSKKCSIF